MNRCSLTLLAGLSALLPADAALAHALLKSASPAPGAAVASPSEIRIRFSEGVEPAFSRIALSGPSGAVVLGKAAVALGDDKTLVVKIEKTLSPGAYVVKWRAVAVDTHRTQGDFAFTVK